jgi:predicted Ser/Thr protein kinase
MVGQPSGHASLLGTAFGGYEVQALIGRGAMGSVYLARDTALNRPVALKVLLGSLARNPAMVRSFHREAQAAAPLRHPNIVRVYAAGIEAGTPFIAMEYVPGETLDRFLRRKGQVAWQTALYIGGQVAEALTCAHRAGIIHRDVKPANILLDRSGRVRLTDFGIANAATHETQGVIGTPQYMSPEQVRGVQLTPSTDLFSLGVILYQMMAGKPPFEAITPIALINRITTEEPVRLNRLRSDIPDDVARIVALLLEKRPENRPASAQDLAAALGRLQQEEGGRSAIPEALAAFVREQANGPTLRLLTPVPQVGAKKAKPGTAKGRRASGTFVAAAAVLLALVAAAGWFVPSSGASRHDPVLDAFVFGTQGESNVVGALPSTSYRFSEIVWEGPVAVVRAEGRADSLAYGTYGVLAVDLQGRECRSLAGPGCPPEEQRVVNPDGSTVCVVATGEDGTQTLFERDAANASRSDRDIRRSLNGIHIVPESVQFSPDGSRIGYLRAETKHELWLVDRSSATVEGALLAVGLVGDRFAFSPDGRLAAVMLLSESGNSEPDICIVDTTRGEIQARLGPGYIDSHSWHASGTDLLATSKVGADARQLWLVPVNGDERRRLTGLTEGVGIRMAISPEGDWAAALANEDTKACVVFARIDTAETEKPLRAAAVANLRGRSHA